METWRPLSGWHGRHRTLAVCIVAYFGVRTCQVVLGPIVPGLVASFGVSYATVGLTFTGMWVAYALVQVPSGAFADRLGERRVVVAALVLTAVATLGLALARSAVGFGLAVAAIGLGAGTYYNPATMLVERTAGGVGRAVGTHRVGGQVAGVVAPAGAAVVGLGYGWRGTVALAALCVVVAAVAFARGTSPIRPSRRSVQPTTRLPWPILLRPHARSTTAMMTGVEFVGVATMAFVSTLLVEHHGLASGVANLLFAAYFATAALSQPLAGWLSDEHGRDRTLVLLAGAGVLGYGGLAAGGPLLVAGLSTVLAGLSMSSTPVIQSRMLDGLGPDERGAGFGVFRTVYLLLGAAGTAVVGAVADVAGWGPAFGLLGVLFLALLLILVAVGSSGPP